MIVGLGIDVVEIPRIRKSLERFGDAFAVKLLHDTEKERLGDRLLAESAVAYVAARFAGKEAAVKALGTGFSGGICERDVRILSLPSGQPVLSFHGKALEKARELHVDKAHISLTHGREIASAIVILESLP